MQNHSKQSYHPFILIAFYLNILPESILVKIPRSTRYDWEHKSEINLFGYEWYLENQNLFNALQQIVTNKKLLKINKALIRIIAIRHFLQHHQTHIRYKHFNATATAINNIQKVKDILGARLTLKYLNLSRQQYWQLKQKQSVSNLF